MAGLGIYHFNARFYSPKLGRFLSADTITPNVANPQDLNRYSYVRNNPLRYIDPSGHMAWEGDGGGGCTTYASCFPKPAPPKPAPPPTIVKPVKDPKAPTVTATGTPTVPTTLPTNAGIPPSSTPNPFVTNPPIVSTQTPAQPVGWTPPAPWDWEGNELVDAAGNYLLPGDSITTGPDLPLDFKSFSEIIDDIGMGLPKYGVPAIYEVGKWYSLEKPIEIIGSWLLKGGPSILYPLSPDTNPFNAPYLNPTYPT